MAAGSFADAMVAYEEALKAKPGDSYLVQQLALATYKSKQPSELEALMRGLEVLGNLQPASSNDPETLEICGAIRKRLWLLTKDRIQLDLAIRLYGRGFEIRRDYYNGENLATCLDMRAVVQSDPNEAQFDRMSAHKVRLELVEILQAIITAPSFADRPDRKWVYATFANCCFALGSAPEGGKYEQALLLKDLLIGT